MISALVGHGKPRRLVAALLERHQIVSSRQILAEFADVLAREKFSGIDESEVNSFLSILNDKILLVAPKQIRKVVVEDPEDDVILCTADEGRASCIVSGDRHLLDLGTFKGIRILGVAKMLEILD